MVTAVERAAWAAAGALATLAALAGLAVHWGRAVERNEAYGTWQVRPSDELIDGGFDPGGRLVAMPESTCELPGCVLHEPD